MPNTLQLKKNKKTKTKTQQIEKTLQKNTKHNRSVSVEPKKNKDGKAADLAS